MSNQPRKDNLRESKPLPSTQERAKEKGAPKDKGFSKFAKAALFVGVGGFFGVCTLLLWRYVPPSEIEGFRLALRRLLLDWRYDLFLVYLIVATIAITILLWRAIKRQPLRIMPPVQIKAQPPPSQQPSPAPGPQATAPSSPLPPHGIQCVLCEQPVEAPTWIELFSHIEGHFTTLKGVMAEYPDKSEAKALIAKWFVEV